MAQLPFMDIALWRMPLVARLQESAFETDGRLLWFDAARVIDLYRKNPNEVLRGYFHTIMHCVFRHPFDDKHPERALWDIACDASVEATAIELLGTGFPSAQDVAAKRMLDKIRENCPTLTAQSIYRALIGTGVKDPPAFSCSFAASLENVFARDGHEAWPRTSERGSSMKSAGDKLALMPSDGTDKLNGKPDDDADSEDKSRSPGANMPGMAAPSSSSNAVLGDIEDPDAIVDVESSEEAEATFESMERRILLRFLGHELARYQLADRYGHGGVLGQDRSQRRNLPGEPRPSQIANDTTTARSSSAFPHCRRK